ncbi:hypothetical protein EJB05_38176, partial [Eragrostis curvula]
SVTLLEANHCPGAALIHFRLSDIASLSLILSRSPSQEKVIDFFVRTAQRYLQKQPKTLTVVGAYNMGSPFTLMHQEDELVRLVQKCLHAMKVHFMFCPLDLSTWRLLTKDFYLCWIFTLQAELSLKQRERSSTYKPTP